MRNFLDCCIGLAVLALLGLGMAISGLLHWRWLGQMLVRLKHWCLAVMEGRERVNYRELWILLTGAVGIGLVMFCGQVLAGSLVALLGQYFWIADTWRARAWGKCALSIYFTLAYVVGALRAWGA